MNKQKVLLIGGVVVGLLAVSTAAGAYYYFNVLKKSEVTLDGSRFVAGQNRFAGGTPPAGAVMFGGQTGKVISKSDNEIIIDSSTSQIIVNWNEQTVVNETVNSDSAGVAVVGNTVSIMHTTVDGVNKATTVAIVDTTLLSAGGQTGARPSGAAVQFGGGSGPQGAQTRTNNNSTGSEKFALGKIEAVNGNIITISNMDGSQKTDYDISAAKFTLTQKATIADIKVGDTLTVGGSPTNGKVTARDITIKND